MTDYTIGYKMSTKTSNIAMKTKAKQSTQEILPYKKFSTNKPQLPVPLKSFPNKKYGI